VLTNFNYPSTLFHPHRNEKDLRSGTSAEEKTVPSTEDKPTRGITFPELPDPDQFLESIISSKINSESSDDTTPGNSADPKGIIKRKITILV
jgi:hypothetical protein